DNNVTIASSRAPRVTFVADGETRTETGQYGRPVTTRATIYGDQLMVSSTGNGNGNWGNGNWNGNRGNSNRGNDFSVTFEPMDNGRTLLVTRRVSVENLTQPVTVRSYYRETSPQPRWDLETTGETGESASYLVP